MLVDAGIAYPRGSGGHDLRLIVEMLPAAHPLRAEASALFPLTPWATAFRYLADDPLTAEPVPTTDQLQAVFELISRFRDEVAKLVGVRP